MKQVFLSTNVTRVARAELGADGVWSVKLMLEGQKVSSLAANRRQTNIVYAGTRGNGVLKSEDYGQTWHSSGLAGYDVKSVAVSPVEDELVFAGMKPPALFVSRNGGETWNEVEPFRKTKRWWWFTPSEPGAPYIQSIALSPTDPDEIVVGIEFGAVLRSSDGGKTWSTHAKGANRDCHAMTYHVTDGRWLYEAGGTGASYSDDGGETWHDTDPAKLIDYINLVRGGAVRPTTNGLDRRYCYAVGADSVHPEVWYISASPGPMKAHREGMAEAYIYRMKDGSKWKRLSGGLPQPMPNMPYALLCDPQASGHLYAGLSNGDIWHTTDFGDHWQQLPVNMGSIWTAMIMIKQGST
jgi:photosystem II stability/assembly factor-like uncharacterized protein